MIFLSYGYILSAIRQLAPVHAFLGITFLTCKREKLPIGTTTQFAMDNLTKKFMNDIHHICPSSEYYFQPFQTIKSKTWVVSKYPSSGLQSLNTRTFKSVFIHKKNSQIWGFSSDYLTKIKEIAISDEKKKIPFLPLAVWIMKDHPWRDTDTLEDVITLFKKEYHLDKREEETLFSRNYTFPDIPVFQNEKCTWTQLSNELLPPPDASPDQEGTLAMLELTNVGPCNHAELQFAPRLNILTGDNGLGKTFIMDCAWWALTNTWVNNEARPKYADGSKKATIGFAISGKNSLSQKTKILYDNKRQTWKRDIQADTIPGLIIYARVDGSYAVWEPSKSLPREKASMVFSREQIWDGLTPHIEGLIRDWVKWQNTPSKYPFDTLKNVLKIMSPPDMGDLFPGEAIRIPNDSREIPTIHYPYGDIPIVNSSAGVSRIITLSYLMVWAWNEHKENCRLKQIQPDSRIVVIIDELEAHLHPKWQRTILPALLNIQNHLSEKLEVQFLLSTHSPLIMASAEGFFTSETDKLFQIKLDLNNANAILQEEDFIKYGQVNSWLTSPIFHLGQARSTDAEKAIERAKKLQLEKNVSNAEVESIHQELVNVLSQHDSFWPRWIYFAEQHGVKI